MARKGLSGGDGTCDFIDLSHFRPTFINISPYTCCSWHIVSGGITVKWDCPSEFSFLLYR